MSRTLERKNQFRAGVLLLCRSSRFCKLCKHVKTLCFGRNFPYRRETLQNFDCESPIFEFLQFGTILLKFKRGVFLSRSVSFFHMYVAQLFYFLKIHFGTLDFLKTGQNSSRTLCLDDLRSHGALAGMRANLQRLRDKVDPQKQS